MRRAEVRALNRIVAVRAAQEEGARLDARRARDALTAAETRQDSEASLQDDRETAWRAEMSGTALRFEASRAWAHALVVGQARLEQLTLERDDAEEARAARHETWRGAHGRADVARTLSRDGARRLRRREDETALNDMADRSAGLRGRHED